MTEKIRLAHTVESGGCSAKLGARDLEDLMSQVSLPSHPDIIVGAESFDDAGVIRLPDGRLMVQTTDFFPPMVDGPFEFGQIAVANALSDVYAMGGAPFCALNLVMFPKSELPPQVLVQMIEGGVAKMREAGVFLLGGHTIDDTPLKYGLAVTGFVEPDQLVTNKGARPGDLLVLSKALGTSILTGAHKVDLITDQQVMPAVASMTTLNDKACEQMVRAGVKGGTDITGFGLLGHAFRFAASSDVTFRLDTKLLPVLPGVIDLIEMGVIPGGCMRNLDFIKGRAVFLPSLDNTHKWLALDPQTSGGLLMSVPAAKVEGLLRELHQAGVEQATVIGEVLQPGSQRLLVA